MVVQIYGATLCGCEPYVIEAEIDISRSIQPTFNIVGLPDMAIKESRDRIRNAIRNSGFRYPYNRITVNLAPADLKKEGSHLDLPIALGVIQSLEDKPLSRDEKLCFIGELALDGRVRKVRGILPIIMVLRDAGFKKVIVPYDSAKEAGLVNQMEIYPAKTLKDAYLLLEDINKYTPHKTAIETTTFEEIEPDCDFYDVRGQTVAKEALKVAAAGGHNLLMIGAPGSGKTMLARRVPSILPPLTFEEALETSKIYSLSGTLDNTQGIITRRPFRAPHHTISDIALIGGGTNPKPGEVSMAHNGILFLDELLEFRKNVLEVLRQPLENGEVTISRVLKSLTFSARFMLIAAMNPCPCGNLGDAQKKCTCSPYQIQRYLNKLSQPLLDRIDIHIRIHSLEIQEITGQRNGEHSSVIREQVIRARERQLERFAGKGIYANAQMSTKMIEALCPVNRECRQYLQQIIEQKGLSARAYYKILKLARTVADLAEDDTISIVHIAQACQYRILDQREQLLYQ